MRPVVTWTGLFGLERSLSNRETLHDLASRSTISTTITTNEYWAMAKTPYLWAGLRFRDFSRLWTGAAEIREDDGSFARAQVIAKKDTPQLDFCRWVIDERIQRSMKQIIEQSIWNKLPRGKSVAEIGWIKQSGGEYDGFIVVDDLKDIDPDLFHYYYDTDINKPVGYSKPGLYMREVENYGLSYKWRKVDERRFFIVTNHLLHEDYDGISEFEPLLSGEVEKKRQKALKDWSRGVERSGQGLLFGYYPDRFEGNSYSGLRAKFVAAMQKLSSSVVGIFHKDTTVEHQEITIQSDAFRDLTEELKVQESLVMTGSPTTLKEGKFGNQSMAESTEVRQESNLEQADAADFSDAFTEQILAPLCDFNFSETTSYPYMQIVSP